MTVRVCKVYGYESRLIFLLSQFVKELSAEYVGNYIWRHLTWIRDNKRKGLGRGDKNV